ncbi:hypothetical protein ACJJIF_13370 [Microbulbifer sp. SSSA002]|uniref:hypothetical protein n=1 Tax=unclassified Microbulbifer TaxID=2619833 RepID=UPI00403A2D93
MKNLRIGGFFLQFHGYILLACFVGLILFSLFSGAVGVSLAQILVLSIFIVFTAALILTGKKVKLGNRKYKIIGLALAAISLVTSPVGMILGLVSLFFQVKGSGEYTNT